MEGVGGGMRAFPKHNNMYSQKLCYSPVLFTACSELSCRKNASFFQNNISKAHSMEETLLEAFSESFNFSENLGDHV